ncbi:MAG TPA: hypothetical protein VF157_10405 [Chloroflexota bacterium]
MKRLTLRQASDTCGLAISSLRQAVGLGRLKAEKFGRDWITSDVALQRYLDSRRRGNFLKGDARTGSLRRKAS